MGGTDKYPIHLGFNENVPFRSYDENNPNHKVLHDINVVAMNKDSDRATCIVVEKDGKYADFYYNGSEENFKQLTEPCCETIVDDDEDNELVGSWEYENFGTTPEVIIKNGVSIELIKELIEGIYK